MAAQGGDEEDDGAEEDGPAEHRYPLRERARLVVNKYDPATEEQRQYQSQRYCAA